MILTQLSTEERRIRVGFRTGEELCARPKCTTSKDISSWQSSSDNRSSAPCVWNFVGKWISKYFYCFDYSAENLQQWWLLRGAQRDDTTIYEWGKMLCYLPISQMVFQKGCYLLSRWTWEQLLDISTSTVQDFLTRGLVQSAIWQVLLGSLIKDKAITVSGFCLHGAQIF